MKRILLLAIFLFPLFSAQAQKFKPMECGFTLSFVPAYSPTGQRSIFLSFATNDVYGCSNNELGVESNVSAGKVFVKIRGMAEAIDCDNVMGPATTRVDISSLAKGEHGLTLYINKMLFTADLTVSENSVYLKLGPDTDPDLVRIINPRLNLLPGNALWGRVEYIDPTMKAVAEQFMEDVKNEGARPTQLEAGNYGEVYLHAKGKTEERKMTGGSMEYPFVFEYDGDPERVKLLVDMYTNRYAGKIRIHLANPTGMRYSMGTF